jgi:hypothetical protein
MFDLQVNNILKKKFSMMSLTEFYFHLNFFTSIGEQVWLSLT